MPKHLYKNRESLNKKIKSLHKHANHDATIQYLDAVNLSINDFNYKNFSKSYSKIIVNDKHLFTKIIKRTDFNVLNFKCISNYIEEEVKEVQILFSIMDDNFTYKIENEEIILSKNGVEYTLQIVHDITYSDIISRVPKYLEKLSIEQPSNIWVLFQMSSLLV